MSVAINQKNLALLPKDISIPDYDRSKLRPGFVHFGVGNFHRAHMAIYLDRLFARAEAHDWAIVGAGLRPSNAGMREKLKAQDWLTTVVELAPFALTARVTCAMIDFVPIDPEPVLAVLVDPRIRIVTLTVTEGGYYIDAATGGLAVDDPENKADAANPADPRTVFGMMIKALAMRKAAGCAPFAVLSCDNLPGNGHLTRQTVVSLARLSDPALADWIAANVPFPNAMVDCIVPMTTERERKLVEERFGVTDAAPVVCEPFRQRVIEDNFPSGRPPLERGRRRVRRGRHRLRAASPSGTDPRSPGGPVARRHRRHDGGGMHAVDADAMLPELQRRGAGDVVKPCLGSIVGDMSGQGDEGRLTRDVDDRATLAEPDHRG